MCLCFKTRRLEPFYTHSKNIAEWYNTWSNLPFIIIGVTRLFTLPMEEISEVTNLFPLLYYLYILCGVMSAIHHASRRKWTIVLDWLPISASIFLVYYFGLYSYMSNFSMVTIGMALSVLCLDHLHNIDVPIGHSMWHILAAFAVDHFYQDVFDEYMSDRLILKYWRNTS